MTVAYYPDEHFCERLQRLLPQVKILVVDNTPAPGGRLALALGGCGGRIHLIENHRNVGIAAALNQGLEYALQMGCKWLLTMDQDTRCHPDMVPSLLRALDACGANVAVVGSNYFDAHNHRPMFPASGDRECLEQKTVITSGSLVDGAVARALGGFREDYFIDQVDHEFCLRVRAHGYRVVVSRKPVMEHSVGKPGGVRLPFLGVLPSHPPLRKYYIARNTVVTVANYWRQEPEWCLRRLLRLLLGLGYMAVLEKDRVAKVRAFMAGITDGVVGRMGPCARAWLLRADRGS